MTKIFSPTAIIYLLVHLMAFIIGIFIIALSFLIGKTSIITTIMLGVGSSMMAAGIVGWTIFIYVRTSENISIAFESWIKFGFIGIFSNRSIVIREQYDKRIEKFSKGVDIMGFGLNSLRQDHIQSFGDWKEKGPIRILLIDPEYPSQEVSFSKQRDMEENEGIGTINQQVRQFVRDTRNIQELGRFEIRLYRCLPMLNIFRIDDDVLWGPYFIHEASRNSPTFINRSGGEIYRRLMDHFNTIWNDQNLSRSIPDNWIEE